MKKIAILGGTFDPIHNGHIIILQTLFDSKKFDSVWLMPAGQQPFKNETNESRAHRRHMCELLCEVMPHITLSNVEIERNGPSYTYETLTYLSQQNQDCRFYWVIGYDNLPSVLKWRNSEELLKNHGFIVVNRSGFNNETAETILHTLDTVYQTEIVRINIPNIEISSTLLRSRTFNQQSLIGYTLESISDYIWEHGLYQGSTTIE